jgi:hypothetical protein
MASAKRMAREIALTVAQHAARPVDPRRATVGVPFRSDRAGYRGHAGSVDDYPPIEDLRLSGKALRLHSCGIVANLIQPPVSYGIDRME